MNDDYDVFLSYSSSDVSPRIFDEIVRYFEPSMYRFSRDSNDFGEELKHSLSEKISRCRLMLVMITPGALQSAWVRFEIQTAQAHKKPIVAITPDDLSDDKLPTELRHTLAIKYTTVEGLRPDLKRIREQYLGYTAYIMGGGFGGGMVEFCAEVPKALCHIGDRPMLFHVIDSLEASPFRKAVIVNQEHQAPDFISYMTKLEYSKERELARGHAGFSGDVTCVSTHRERWPQALKDLAPKDTFLVNMCDIILSFDECARTKTLQELQWDWREAVNRHRHMRQEWGRSFLGTLITCNYYRLAAGIILEMRPGAAGEIRKVKENPETPVPLTMNTGVAILEPGIVEYIEETDESLLEGAISRVLDENHERRFVEYRWPHWSHVLHLLDLKLLHRKRLSILQKPDPC